MESTMRAMMFLEPGKIQLCRVPVPSPGDGELLVRVRAATTCGTDLKMYNRGHPKFSPPFIFGHEFAGDVAALGTGVKGFEIGMRVTANVFAECGECFYCHKEQGNLCTNLIYNFGAFAEFITIPASIVRSNTYRIPEHLSYAQAACLEPLVAVVHGQRLINIQPGEHIAIIGAGGPISLMHIQMAKLAGAEQIIAVGHSEFRLKVAEQLGATLIVNARKQDAISSIVSHTEGRGADVVIECAGSKVAWENSVRAVRRGGRVLWFGGLPADTAVEIDAARVHYGEIALFGVHGGTVDDAKHAFYLIDSGTVDVKPLLSGSLPLELLELALRKMDSGGVIKMVIIPDEGIYDSELILGE